MGGQISIDSKLLENEILRKFSGLESITDNDPYWNKLLSFNWKISEIDRNESKVFEDLVGDFLEALLYNTPTTGNFAALTTVFLRRSHEVKQSVQCEDKIFLWQTGNALIILRITCKFLLERLTEQEFIKCFDKNILSKDGQLRTSTETDTDHFESAAEEFTNALVDLIVELPLNDACTVLHCEAVKCLLVLLSAQLYKTNAHVGSPLLKYLMQRRGGERAATLAKCLVRNYVLHSNMQNTHTGSGGPFDTGGSMVLGIASSLFSVVQWGLSADEQSEKSVVLDASLGNSSVLLLQCLACYAHSDQSPNPYRLALATFLNSQERSSSSTANTFKYDYNSLYAQLCVRVGEQPSMLLLYILLHSNTTYRNYVLSRVNIEDLVLPVLKALHAAHTQPPSTTSNDSSSQHVYLALVLLLILSEDEFYCKVVQETVIKQVEWYSTERSLTDISLGALLVLVLVRVIQVNIVKLRDRYLHTNSLAALSNMSAYFKQLPPLVCQKLIGLLELLGKRHAKLLANMQLGEHMDAEHTNKQHNLLQQDLCAFEEAIRTLLEIINRCLTYELRNNIHLIHTMLYKGDVFNMFKQHAMFHDLVGNISAVLTYFSGRVKTQAQSNASVTELLEVIQKGALQWPTDRLKKFPDMTFRYVEDENTEEFFVPYVWQLVYEHSTLYWPGKHVKLFTTNRHKPAPPVLNADEDVLAV